MKANFIPFLLLLGLVLSLENVAFARKKRGMTKEGKKSSRSLREKKPVGVAGTAGWVYTGVGGGAEAWYNTSRSFQLGMNFLVSKGDATAEGDEKEIREQITIGTTEIGGKFRYFLAPRSFKSFFISSGLSYDQFSGEYGVRGMSSSATEFELMTAYSAKAVLAHASFGNQWEFRNGFVLSADWIGGSYFLSNNVSAEEEIFEKSGAAVSPVGAIQNAPGSSAEGVDAALRKQIQIKSLVSLGWSF